MTRTNTGPVHDARPPEVLVRVMNPVVRALLRSPVGRKIRPLVLIEYTGRRTGTRRKVVVAWHELDGRRFVVTPASWRANFDGGAPAIVRHCGATRSMTATLDADPATVAHTLTRLVAAGHAPKTVGLAVEPGHVISPEDVVAVHRAVVWFDPDPAPLA